MYLWFVNIEFSTEVAQLGLKRHTTAMLSSNLVRQGSSMTFETGLRYYIRWIPYHQK